MVAASDCACIHLQNYSMTEVNKSLLKANPEDAFTMVVPTSENTYVRTWKVKGRNIGSLQYSYLKASSCDIHTG